MKTLQNVKVTASNGKVTITADILDKAFDVRTVQQTTVLYVRENRQWPRHIQVSGEAVFVKAFGNGFAISHNDLVAIATAVEPKTSYPPVLRSQLLSNNLTVNISSELNPDFQWQSTDSLEVGKVNWQDIAGANTQTLDPSKASGKFVRCVASSEAGVMNSNPVLVK